MTALRYGDVVIIDWRGNELDREAGRVGTLANDPGVDVPAGAEDVTVTVARRGEFEIPRDKLRPFGALGWPHEQPQVGEVVAVAAAWPEHGIEQRQLARIIAIGPLPDSSAERLGVDYGLAGYRLETASGIRRGARVRAWVTGSMFYRLHEIGRAPSLP